MSLFTTIFKNSKRRLSIIFTLILILSALLYFRLPKLENIQVFDNDGNFISNDNITNKSIGKEPYKLTANLQISSLTSNKFRIFGDDCINSLKINGKNYELPKDNYDNKDCFKSREDFELDNLHTGINLIEVEIGDKGGWYFGFGINNSIKDPLFAINLYLLGITIFAFLIYSIDQIIKSKVYKNIVRYTNLFIAQKPRKIKRLLIFLVIALVFLVGIYIRLPELNKAGYGYDVGLFRDWGENVMKDGFVSVYGKINIDYPPIYPIQLAFAQGFWQNVLHNDSKSEEFTKVIKYMNLAVDIFITLLVIYYLKDKSLKLGIIIGSLYFLNPAMIYDSAIWGQIDNMIFLYLLLILICFKNKRFVLIPIFALIGLLTKTQLIIFLPIIAIFWLIEVLKSKNIENYRLISKVELKLIIQQIFKLLIPTLVLIFSILFLFLLQAKVDEFVKIYTTASGRFPYLSMNSYNVWWLAQGNIYNWELNPSSRIILLNLSAKQIGLYFFAVIYLLLIINLIKKKNLKNLESALFLISVSFFVLNTEMHERYLLTAIPLAALMIWQNKKYLGIYLILSLTNYFMLAWAMSYDPSFENTKNLWYGAWTNMLSILNITVLLLSLVLEARSKADHLSGQPKQVQSNSFNPSTLSNS